MKPSRLEATALSKLFPSSQASLPKLAANFDPGSDCVFAEQKKRKKSARVKPSKLNLAFLRARRVPTTIPRGKHRKDLVTNGRIRKVDFTREMSAQVVKNTIITAFSELQDFNSSYNILSQSQDGRLTLADNQYPSGVQFVDKALKHRGNVYLTCMEEVQVGCM
ncbi:MAG: hypothetical protein HFP76_00190 [Methylococcales symbiont of Iophon sp. n. MRB-2018]|nr:MAG: hypothetical protein HFP76_00190 [Methylococcales symbiont of Iophon sp. n. MRB-2018]